MEILYQLLIGLHFQAYLYHHIHPPVLALLLATFIGLQSDHGQPHDRAGKERSLCGGPHVRAHRKIPELERKIGHHDSEGVVA
jgi:hypothetical protein